MLHITISHFSHEGHTFIQNHKLKELLIFQKEKATINLERYKTENLQRESELKGKYLFAQDTL